MPITVDYTIADACGPVTTTLSVMSNEAVTAAPNVQGKPDRHHPTGVSSTITMCSYGLNDR